MDFGIVVKLQYLHVIVGGEPEFNRIFGGEFWIIGGEFNAIWWCDHTFNYTPLRSVG